MLFVSELPLGLVVQWSLPGDAQLRRETLPVGDALEHLGVLCAEPPGLPESPLRIRVGNITSKAIRKVTRCLRDKGR